MQSKQISCPDSTQFGYPIPKNVKYFFYCFNQIIHPSVVKNKSLEIANSEKILNMTFTWLNIKTFYLNVI